MLFLVVCYGIIKAENIIKNVSLLVAKILSNDVASVKSGKSETAKSRAKNNSTP